MSIDQAIYSIDLWAQEWHRDNAEQIPGLVICLHGDDTIKYSRSFGTRLLEPDKMLDTNPLLPLASISKTFTALAVLQLIHEHKKHPLTGRELSLDDNITELLSQLKVDWMEGATLRDALEHRTKIGHISDEWGMSPAQLREKGLKGVNPDEKVGYSNRMYNWLGVLIEDVSNVTFHQYIEKEIVGKHNLGEIYPSYHAIPTHIQSQVPTGCLSNKLIPVSAADPCGGFYARAESVAKFFSKLAKGDILSEHMTTADVVSGMFSSHDGKGMGILTAHFGKVEASCNANPYKVDGAFSNPLGDLFGHTGGMNKLRADVRYNPHTDITAAIFQIGTENNAPVGVPIIISKIFYELL